MLPDKRPERSARLHTPPPWVDDSASFFITIACKPRGQNQLVHADTATQIFESVRFYHDQQKWFPEIVLLMPDHLHAIISFPWDENLGMSKVIANWKRFIARSLKISWQRDYFDHRIRSEADHAQTWTYIRENPVNSKLVDDFTEWPHVWFPNGTTGWTERENSLTE